MIIGSQAMYHHGFTHRFPFKDLDIVIQYETPIDISNYKERVEYLDNYVLISWIKEKYGYIPKYCPKDELYTLKMSHVIGWDLENNSWDKHVFDLIKLKESCTFIPELFYKLYDYWNTLHGKNKRSELEMSSEDFFNNSLNFDYKGLSHDQLHELLVKHEYFLEKIPTYKKVLVGEVEVGEEKFNQLSELDKFNLAFEEIAIMNWEGRYPKEWHWKSKYVNMLKKFIINHAPIWEGIWILQNYDKLVIPPFNFEEHLNKEFYGTEK